MDIITASYTLPMTNGGAVVPDGAIAVELGKILAFGTGKELAHRFPDAELHSYPGCVLMPGLINAHCHLDLVDFFESAGLEEPELAPAPGEFTDMLVASIDYKHDARPEQVMRGTQKGIERLIETGVTCAGDMTHFEGTFQLIADAGLRAVVFPEILAGRGEAAQLRFETALALLEKYTDARHDRLRVGLGPYAPYLLSRNLLKIISRHARDASIPLMIHAAESFSEMEFFFDSAGLIATEVFPSLGWTELPPAQHKTPVAYLAEIGFFEAPTTIVGGLHLSREDFPILARHLARVVWCPTANMLMKHGTFPYGRLSEYGIPMGLGTECWQTALGFNMWEEMRSATREGAAPTPSPKEALHMATLGSARTLGIDHLVGTLEEGKKADYIIVAAPSGAEGEEKIYGRLVAKTQPHHVHQVVVSGNILKSI
jgi:cytosine/adenosine deaminase-related metal-dependent hydrolase